MGLNKRRRKFGKKRICSRRSSCIAAGTEWLGPSTTGKREHLLQRHLPVVAYRWFPPPTPVSPRGTPLSFL